jgi:hypothetical protein
MTPTLHDHHDQDCRARRRKTRWRRCAISSDLPEGVIYLDGNSLGVLPKATAARVAAVVHAGMGPRPDPAAGTRRLVRPAATHGRQDRPLVGAGPNEVVAADSTSVNLFKVLSAALNIAARTRPQRRVVVSERSNFPTDLYIAEGAVQASAAAPGAGGARGDRRRAGNQTTCRADAHPCELPHRRHARHGRRHRRRARRRRAGGVGPGAQRRRGAGGLTAAAPTSPWAAATNT